MASINTVQQAGFALGWHLEDLRKGLSLYSSDEDGRCSNCISKLTKEDVLFTYEEVDETDDMELSRCVRMKHKAIKPEVVQALDKFNALNIKAVDGHHPKGEAVHIDWDSLPGGAHPKEGDVPTERAKRKCQQLENLATAIQAIARPGDVIVDFCSGGVLLVENKEESLLKSCSRLKSLKISNVSLYQCNMDYFIGNFDVGTCLHACGPATDMVLQLCLQSKASFVICPCCYGSIHNTHLLSYPRSKYFIDADVSYKDFLTLGHAADQTEFKIALEDQGRKCMHLIDTDRAHYAKELGYQVTLCSLHPLSCTPKNNLLIGTLAN